MLCKQNQKKSHYFVQIERLSIMCLYPVLSTWIMYIPRPGCGGVELQLTKHGSNFEHANAQQILIRLCKHVQGPEYLLPPT